MYVILFPFEWREPFLMGPYLDTYFNYQLNHTPIPSMRNFVDKKDFLKNDQFLLYDG